jgi:hypothetical protein
VANTPARPPKVLGTSTRYMQIWVGLRWGACDHRKATTDPSCETPRHQIVLSLNAYPTTKTRLLGGKHDSRDRGPVLCANYNIETLLHFSTRAPDYGWLHEPVNHQNVPAQFGKSRYAITSNFFLVASSVMSTTSFNFHCFFHHIFRLLLFGINSPSWSYNGTLAANGVY